MRPAYNPPSFLVLAALLFGAGACTQPKGDPGDDESDGNADTTTATTSSGETTMAGETTTPTGGEMCPLDEAADQCCCFAHSPECAEPTQVLCEATVACDDIQAVFGGDVPVLNPEALECALTALRDRTPGQIRVMYSQAMSDTVSSWLFLYVQADGTVFENEGTGPDEYALALVHRSLPPADVFEQCLLEPDLAARLVCVEMASDGEQLEQCLPSCSTGAP